MSFNCTYLPTSRFKLSSLRRFQDHDILKIFNQLKANENTISLFTCNFQDHRHLAIHISKCHFFAYCKNFKFSTHAILSVQNLVTKRRRTKIVVRIEDLMLAYVGPEDRQNRTTTLVRQTLP